MLVTSRFLLLQFVLLVHLETPAASQQRLGTTNAQTSNTLAPPASNISGSVVSNSTSTIDATDGGVMPIYEHGDKAHKYRANLQRQKELLKELALKQKECEKDYPASSVAKLSEGQLHTLRFITLCSAFLSFGGASFIIASYIRFKNLRTFAFKLIMLLR